MIVRPFLAANARQLSHIHGLSRSIKQRTRAGFVLRYSRQLYPLVSGKYYNIEIDLTNIEGEPQEDGNTAVKSAAVSTLRLVDQPITLFTVQSARYGTLPKK